MRFVLFLSFLFLNFGISQAQTWDWAKSVSGKNTDQIWGVVADNKGSVYVAGCFKDTTFLTATDSLVAGPLTKGYFDAFVAKYSDQGNLIWSRSFGGNRDDIVYNMTCDSAGSIYLACHTRSTSAINYDSFSYTGTGNNKIFILKIDSGSNLIWGKVVTSGISTAMPVGIAVNNTGSLVISGYYSNLDLVIDTTTLTHIHNEDAFIAKFSSINGNLKWARAAVGYNTQMMNSVAMDDSGNVYTSGIHNNTIRFSSTDTVYSPSSSDYRTFLSKHDSLGNVLWLRSYFGPGSLVTDGISITRNSDIYMTGWHGSGNHTLNDSIYNTGSGLFLQKVSPAGHSYWTRNFSATGRIRGIATDSSENVYLAGFNAANITFDNFSVKGSSPDYRNFIVKIGPNGRVFVASAGGNKVTNNTVDCLSADNSGAAYIVGYFGSALYDSSQFDSSVLISRGNYDGYIAKYNTSSICGVQAAFTVNSIDACPNQPIQFTNITPLATAYSWMVNDSLISWARDTSYTFTQPGNYSVKLISSTTYCSDSVSRLIVVNPIFTSIISHSICAGDSLYLAGKYRSSTGTYYDSLETTFGCDSVLKHELVVNPNYYINNQSTICEGDSLFLAGKFRSLAGTYFDSLKTIFGCDSILEHELIVNPTHYEVNQQNICEGDSLNVFGTYRKLAGTYLDSLKTQLGCDSVHVLVLTVNALPGVSFSGLDTLYCLNDPSSLLTGSPSGGTFSGPGISGNIFTPSVAGIGGHAILYSYVDTNNCSNQSSKMTKVNVCTSLGEVENVFFHIYPNPGTGLFNFETTREETIILISDLTGKTVFTTLIIGNDTQNRETLDLRHLTAGVYQVKAISGEDVIIEKLSIY